jgi:hypothetical protein
VHIRSITVVAAAILSSALSVRAQPQPPRGPPPESFGACEGKNQSDPCSLQLPDRAIDGSCVEGSEGKLFCRPNTLPKRTNEHHLMPVPEAFTACDARKPGDACSVELRGETVAGSCMADEQNRLFCSPTGPPPGGGE